ncbi:hypothetical protein CGZ93_04190 [Enemella dayhoffiae]|uniref:Membrane protein YczE n=2 Tax=Enemella dayhoffiae TaxID=2016507 RepID=A0A255H9N7_9ACTN|nr:hypothetical protein CGZ93_04190 [Enemella dayhoffiae]
MPGVRETGRMVRRLIQLYLGVALYGFSLALTVRANLGLSPWDVFHQGVAQRIGWRIGTVLIVTSLAVLLLWIPLRQRPGLGTISNAVLVGVAMNATLDVLPPAQTWWWRAILLVAGVVLNGFATAAYIGARLGPGPRDGLMTGLVGRTGRSVRLIRTGIEVVVLAIGWLLGGTVGIGTLAYAFGIGPITHFFMPLLVAPQKPPPQVDPEHFAPAND